MNGHVAKPVRQRDLQQAIAGALASRPRVAAGKAPAPAPAPAPASAPAPAADEGIFDPRAFDGVLEIIPVERLTKHVADLEAEVALVAAGTGSGDEAALIASAHKVVSQAGMLGLARLSGRARAVEDACRAGNGADAALRSFRDAAGDVERHVRPRLR
jgi:hypothetical protein